MSVLVLRLCGSGEPSLQVDVERKTIVRKMVANENRLQTTAYLFFSRRETALYVHTGDTMGTDKLAAHSG